VILVLSVLLYYTVYKCLVYVHLSVEMQLFIICIMTQPKQLFVGPVKQIWLLSLNGRCATEYCSDRRCRHIGYLITQLPKQNRVILSTHRHDSFLTRVGSAFWWPSMKSHPISVIRAHECLMFIVTILLISCRPAISLASCMRLMLPCLLHLAWDWCIFK
jgi:hypothetical protein